MAKYQLLTALLMCAVVLAGCTNKTEKEKNSNTPTTTEKVNQFLSEKKITLPEGVKRVDLEEVNGSGGTGLVVVDQQNGMSNYSVITDLPELGRGQYVAWIKNEAGEYIKLGTLRSDKGGMMVSYKADKDTSAYKQVVVSQEESMGNSPTNVVLEGSL